MIAVGFPVSPDALRVTIAVILEEHVVPVTEPFAQYMKVSLAAVVLVVGV